MTKNEVAITFDIIVQWVQTPFLLLSPKGFLQDLRNTNCIIQNINPPARKAMLLTYVMVCYVCPFINFFVPSSKIMCFYDQDIYQKYFQVHSLEQRTKYALSLLYENCTYPRLYLYFHYFLYFLFLRVVR